MAASRARFTSISVGFKLSQHLNAVVAVRGLADNGDILVAVEQFAQTFTKDGVIVGHQDTNLLFCRLGHISREVPV